LTVFYTFTNPEKYCDAALQQSPVKVSYTQVSTRTNGSTFCERFRHGVDLKIQRLRFFNLLKRKMEI